MISCAVSVSLLHTREAMEAYEDFAHQLSQQHPGHPASHGLSPYECMCVAVNMYQRMEDMLGLDDSTYSSVSMLSRNSKDKQKLCVCVCVCVLDIEASVSFAFCCYLALFNVISGTRNSIDLEQFTNFLEQITQVLTFMKACVCVCA